MWEFAVWMVDLQCVRMLTNAASINAYEISKTIEYRLYYVDPQGSKNFSKLSLGIDRLRAFLFEAALASTKDRQGARPIRSHLSGFGVGKGRERNV